MANYYTVVQYVPDPATDERLNVGVIAFGSSEGINAVFLRNWRRAQQFGDGDIEFIKDFASRVTDAQEPQLVLPIGQGVPLTPDRIREISGEWMNSIQFSEPRASLLPLDRIIDEVGSRLLREPKRKRRAFRDKRVAVRVARESIESVLTQHVASPERHLKRGMPVEGELDIHRFDLGVANGRPLLGVEGLSFEGVNQHMTREVDATAWTIDDVKTRSPDFPMAVVVLPPKSKTSELYRRAKRVFEGLSAEVVEEADVGDWSLERVPALFNHR